MSLQDRHFNAVYADFAGRSDFLVDLIENHAGEKGRLRETIVTSLLREYLPRRYSFGTGFVIDSDGDQSRQCDIVIYDETRSIRLFDRTGPTLFPIECVYAVIEVKTTLDKVEVEDAFGHIASVKRLVPRGEPTFEWIDDKNANEPKLVRLMPPRPLGFVFGFRHKSMVLSTIKRNMEDAMSGVGDIEHHADMCCSLEEGFLAMYPKAQHSDCPVRFTFFPLVQRGVDGKILQDSRGGKLIYPNDENKSDKVFLGMMGGFEYNRLYKVVNHEKHGRVLADSARLLLNTVANICIVLEQRRLGQVPFELYLAKRFGEGFVLE